MNGTTSPSLTTKQYTQSRAEIRRCVYRVSGHVTLEAARIDTRRGAGLPAGLPAQAIAEAAAGEDTGAGIQRAKITLDSSSSRQ